MAAVDTFEVLHPGILTTVQDLGRPGFARYGVAPSGALDGFALRVANLLVGNPENTAALETAVMGLRLKAVRDVVVAVTGANLNPVRDGAPLAMWRSHRIQGRRGHRVFRTGGRIAFLRRRLRRNRGANGPGQPVDQPGLRIRRLAGRALRKGDILCRAGGKRAPVCRPGLRAGVDPGVPDAMAAEDRLGAAGRSVLRRRQADLCRGRSSACRRIPTAPASVSRGRR